MKTLSKGIKMYHKSLKNHTDIKKEQWYQNVLQLYQNVSQRYQKIILVSNGNYGIKMCRKSMKSLPKSVKLVFLV